MSLNGSLGLGVLLEAKDMATGTITRFGKNLQTTAGISSDAAAAIGRHMRGIGAGVATMGVGASFLGAATALAHVSADFSKQIAIVGAVSGATAEELVQLEEAAIKAGIATQFDPSQAAVALGDLAQAGYNTTESISLLNPVLDLAAGSLGKLDPSGAAGLAAQTMKAFGIETGQAGVTVDKLLQAVNVFALSAEEMPLALGTATRGSLAFKQGLDETLISLGLVKNIIPSVERASTSVAVAMEKMVDPKVQAALKGKGVAVVDAGGKFRDFLDIINDMNPALEKLGTDQKRGAFLQETFGPEALGGLQAIMAQVGNGIKTSSGEVVKGGDAIKYLREQFANAGGTAAGFKDKLLDTFDGQEGLVAGSMKTLAIVAGKPFEQALKPAVMGFLGAVNALLAVARSIPAPVQAMIAKGVLFAGTLLVVVGGVLAAVSAFGVMSAGLAAVGMTVGGVVAAFLPVVAALALVTIAFFALREAYDRNLGGMADSVDKAVDKIHLAFSALGQLFSDGGFSGGVLDDLNKADNMGLKNFAIRIYVTVARIKAEFGGLADGFFGVIEAMQPSFDAFMSSLRGIGEAFSGLFETNDSTDAASTFDAFVSAGKTVGTALGTVAKAIVNIATVALDILGGFISKLAPVGDLIGTIFSVVGDVFADISAQLSDMNGSVDGSASGWRAFGETIGNIVAVAAAVIKSLVLTIGGALRSALNIMGGILDLFTGNFERGIKRILYGIVGLISGAVLGAIELVATASDALLGTDFAKSVQGWRKSLDGTLQEGFGLKKHEYAAGSEEDVLNRQQMTAEAQRGMAPDALDFYAPDAMPAVAAADAQSYGPRVDADAVGAAVVAGVKGMPPATTTVIVQIGDEKVGEIVSKAQDASAFRSGAPVMASF